MLLLVFAIFAYTAPLYIKYMALEITQINGVDKLFIDSDNIVYRFPQATVTVNTDTTAITVLLSYAGAVSSTTKFASLTNNYGTADAEGYADYLATNSFFFEVAGTGVGDATAANQVIEIGYLTSIDTKVATSALQTTGNTILGNILTTLGSLATSALQVIANGYLSTIATFTTLASTSANQAIQIQFDKGLDKGNGVQTSVGISNVAVEVVALATDRIGVILFNDGNNTMYIEFGTSTASTTDYTLQLTSKSLYEVPYFACNSRITAIKSSASTDQLKLTVFTRLI